jgi:outer membrane protein
MWFSSGFDAFPRRKAPRLASQLCVLAWLLLVAPLAQAETLIDVFRQAEGHDPRWAAALAAYEAGREKKVQGEAALLPSLSLSGGYTRNRGDIEYLGSTAFTSSDRGYDNGEFGVNLTHPLYRQQNYAVYKQGNAQTELAAAQLMIARAELMLRVAQAYFELLGAQDNLTLAVAETTAMAEQWQQANAMFEAGAVAITDADEARSRYDLARAREAAAKSELELRQQALRRFTGKMPGRLAGLPPPTRLPDPEPSDIDVWVERAGRDNLRVVSQQRALEVAQWELERARAGHHPTLDLVAGYTKGHSTGSVYTDVGSDTAIRNVGVQLQMALYQGGAVESRVRETAANHERARQELEDARLEAQTLARQVFLALDNGVVQIGALEQAVRSSESAIASSRAGMEVGTRNRVDVLNAEQQFFNAKRQHLRSRYEYVLGLLRLKDTAGPLEVADLVSLSRLLSNSDD